MIITPNNSQQCQTNNNNIISKITKATQKNVFFSFIAFIEWTIALKNDLQENE
jgi:hypothetical protein